MTVNDAPSCGITYGCHSDDYGDVIYDCHIYIMQATDFNVIHTFQYSSVSCFVEALGLKLKRVPVCLSVSWLQHKLDLF